jgi:modulator of FtsH protease
VASIDPSAWESFAVAFLGASAVLLGLIFVGLSINLDRLLKLPWLFRRAAAAITLLVVAFLAAGFLLVPGQPDVVLGLELVATGISGAVMVGILLLRGREGLEPLYQRRANVAAGSSAIAALLIAVAGLTLALQAPGGLYWLVPGILLCTLRALMDSWVLLVEINR